MAITRKPPGPPKPTAPAPKEITDEAFDRIARGAIDALPDEPEVPGGRPAKGRKLGTGYVMGKRLQITHMISQPLLEWVNQQVLATGESRAAIINRAITELKERINK